MGLEMVSVELLSACYPVSTIKVKFFGLIKNSIKNINGFINTQEYI
jgi:hypothetical protein